MTYAVDWVLPALHELAAASLGPAGRAAVADASHRLERDLGRNPRGRGVPGFSPISRVAFEWPLVVEYDIIEDDKRVLVTHAWSVV